MSDQLLRDTRDLLNELLAKGDTRLYSTGDLDTIDPNDLGDRVLELLDRIDEALADNLPGLVSRVMSRLRGGA
jgi:hypothetical protein